MTPDERENQRYAAGAGNPVAAEEHALLSLLPPPPAEGDKPTALDVGCGVGDVSLKIRERGYRVTGLDFSAVAVEKAVAKGLEAVHVDVDRTGLPFPDGSFDVVWAGDVVEHVFDPLNLLSEIRRVLKSDGHLLLTVPNDFSLRARLRVFLTGRAVQSAAYRDHRQCKHHTFFSAELLRFMLADAGLRVSSTRSILALPGAPKTVLQGWRLGAWLGRVFIVVATKT